MPLTPNATLQKLRDGRLAIGFGVHHLRSAATPMLAAAAGFDWLFIDGEHGAFSVQEMTQLCLAALPVGITPVVRVCAGAIDEATRALDNGALGVVMPHVNSAAQAREIAAAFRYPPDGHRSWGGPPAAFGYRAPDAAEAQTALNRTILVCAMIETPQAVEQAAAIAAVPGIDALMIGTSDLSAELGVSGQAGHQRIQDAYSRVGDSCRAHGKFLGMGGIYDEQWARHYIERGARLVLGGSDHTLLMRAATARAKFLHALAAAG